MGERIIVVGRVMDEAGGRCEYARRNVAGQLRRPLPSTVDRHNAPLDPNHGAGRSLTNDNGEYRYRDDPARRVSVDESRQRLAAGAHPFVALRTDSSRGWSPKCFSPAIR